MLSRSDRDAAIEAHIPAMRRFALTLTRDRQRADDLVHDALVSALGHWASLRRPQRAKSWLFAILYRTFLGDARRERGEGARQPLEEAMEIGVPASQDMAVAQSEALRALALLPEDQRIVVWLVGVEDLAYSEVAVMLGLPLGTVMSRLARGRERLRSILDGGNVVSMRKAK
ncbi:MAG: sigma-70 family RNA polymerase sigma factor [Hyphomicrobiales bacterium]|nr:sigma-70 family RNA polymerase sigma factor [Hyphomicrobiales bacterium]